MGPGPAGVYTSLGASRMVFLPGQDNPLDQESDRTRRLEARDFGPSRKWVLIFGIGVVVLVAWGVLAVLGLPGAGVVLDPIGLGVVLGGGHPMLLARSAA